MQGEYIMGGCVGGYKKDKTHQELPTGKKMKKLDLQFMQDKYSMGRWVGGWMDIGFMCICLEASHVDITKPKKQNIPCTK